ncbi:hypothetical protein CB1_000880066 [Camelus ferus]|nr:hypothetical protein CB1_000880066 [Camelus ferus]
MERSSSRCYDNITTWTTVLVMLRASELGEQFLPTASGQHPAPHTTFPPTLRCIPANILSSGARPNAHAAALQVPRLPRAAFAGAQLRGKTGEAARCVLTELGAHA